MHAFILQDWTTIRGAVTTVTQGEDFWLDLTPYQDVIFWVDCREVSPSGTTTLIINLQTSPTKDESLFTNIATAVTLTASSSPQIAQGQISKALVPLARYVRWQIVGGTTTWDATFRVLVAANSPGM
jgi:hypothetical protein